METNYFNVLKENGIQWIYDLIVNLMDQDKKYTGLKSIQGKILKSGFERGILKGEVYPDVLPAFKRWTHQGKKIAIYSSGSIHTQQLLFENSTAGNLTGYISCYFDTTTGSKKERESYDKISKKLFVQPLQIVFLSDSLSELDAAKQAGLLTRWSVRSNEPLNQSKKLNTGHSVIFTFDEVYP
jgi:enolase-phosphatase E1